jgi:branched-chain amino acid transport system permease protein
VAFGLSGVVPMVLGLFIGLLSLRLKGHFFAIFTMCVGYILFLAIEKWESLTHGAVGIIGIPVPEAIPTPFGDISFESPRALYYLVLGFLTLGLWAMHRIVDSLLGRSFIAVRNGDDLAESLGINLMRNKLLAFLLSVFYAGTAGGLYAGFVRFLSPDLAGVERTFDMTMYMLIGGAGTLLGPLLGALGVPWLAQYLQFLQDYRFIVFGPLLIVLVIFLPDGIVGWLRGRCLRSRARQPAAGGTPERSSTATPPVLKGERHA